MNRCCPKCLGELPMQSPQKGGVQMCQSCAEKHKDHDPIVELAIGFLVGASDALKKNSRYNHTLTYPDYMCHGHQTAIDRIIEPLLRVRASRDIDQAKDLCGYVALGLSYFLAGCPPSKIQISTKSEDIPYIPQSIGTSNINVLDDSGAPSRNHDFSSKLTGDTE